MIKVLIIYQNLKLLHADTSNIIKGHSLTDFFKNLSKKLVENEVIFKKLILNYHTFICSFDLIISNCFAFTKENITRTTMLYILHHLIYKIPFQKIRKQNYIFPDRHCW